MFAIDPGEAFDFVVSSQFTHHLTDDQVATFIRWMEAHARRGWFIGDLHRHWLPYYGFGLLAWAARWHHFVLSDGRISIARAFVPEDWRRLVRAAGLAERDVAITWHLPFRLCCRATLSGPVIIGGGPAGAAAAIAIAAAGRDVTLIERNAGPADKVCGDFLSAEAIAMIETLGVDLSAASTISAVRLVHGNRIAATRLPFTARGMSRRALDEALLRQAQASGATVLRGHRVGAIEPDHGALRLECGSLGRLVADTVFLATGKHELRGAGRPDRGTGLVGLKMYYALGRLAARGAAPPCRTDSVPRRLCRIAARGGGSGGAVRAVARCKAARRRRTMEQPAGRADG